MSRSEVLIGPESICKGSCCPDVQTFSDGTVAVSDGDEGLRLSKHEMTFLSVLVNRRQIGKVLAVWKRHMKQLEKS